MPLHLLPRRRGSSVFSVISEIPGLRPFQPITSQLTSVFSLNVLDADLSSTTHPPSRSPTPEKMDNGAMASLSFFSIV